jgi:hypothetical protein
MLKKKTPGKHRRPTCVHIPGMPTIYPHPQYYVTEEEIAKEAEKFTV